MEFSKELIEKVQACNTAEELIALAKENDYDLSLEDAQLYFQEFAEGEIADDELDNVAGGQEGCSKPPRAYERVYYQRKEDVMHLFDIGELVEAYPVGMKKHTAGCYVTKWGVANDSKGYYDIYYLEKRSASPPAFINSWCPRDVIENPHA